MSRHSSTTTSVTELIAYVNVADIIAVDDSPLENIEQLLDVEFVMKGGKVYKR